MEHIKPTIYLDNNATTPISPRVQGQIVEWIAQWGNPSSIHWASRVPKTLIREARHRIAQMLKVSPLEIIFTSGGSEGNNSILKGLATRENLLKTDRKQIMISGVEHPSVEKTTQFLAAHGYEILSIPVSRQGQIDMDFYMTHLSHKTYLVSVMLANNETGTIFPVKKMAAKAHDVGALFHTDAVQALGKIPLDLKSMDVDFATFSAHKYYALKGSGFIYVRSGQQLENLIYGGGQERSRRGGTENVLGIAALGEMATFAEEVISRGEKMRELRDLLEKQVLAQLPGASINAAEGKRLPNTSSIQIPGVSGEALLMNLDLAGFAVSTGAACSSGSQEPSPVLLAMGYTTKEAESSLRISLSWFTSEQEVDDFVKALILVVERLQKLKRG